MKVDIPRPEKVLFPDAGITKADLARYYARVAKYMLRHVEGRPVSMQRFPDGIQGYGFYHKDVPRHYPDWIRRVVVRKVGGTVTHAITCDAETLVYLVGQACITPHVWLSRLDRLEQPDRMVFDLDPTSGDFAAVRLAARRLGKLLDQLQLPHFAMVTGSRGVHVWVPLRASDGFGEVRRFAHDVASLFAARYPRELTTELRKAKRGGRILVDVMRNAYAQTAVPPYAVRARAQAPVATPIEWRELSDSRLRPDKYTIRNVFRRLAAKGDPWRDIARHARGLRSPRRRLDELLDARPAG